jgi:hypothetical protein
LGDLFLSNTYILPSSHIHNFSFYKSGPVLIKGRVTSFPETKPNRSSFVLTVEELIQADKVYPHTKDFSVRVYSVSGKVLVRVFKKTTFSYGDRVLLEGRLYKPFSFLKGFNYRDYLKHIDKKGLPYEPLRKFSPIGLKVLPRTIRKEQDKKLRGLVEKTGKKISELVREAVNNFVGPNLYPITNKRHK